MSLAFALFIHNKQQKRQDIPEQSLRDVLNDVSKYIRNISISLNAVLPKLPDNHDRAHSHGQMSSPPTISITTGCAPDAPDVLVGSSSRVPCNYPEIDFVGYINFRTFRFLVSSEQLAKGSGYSVWKTPQPHPPVLFHEFVEYFLAV